ncbi:zinc finger CCCH domain-containing protein 15-like [Babylonia areolata]|uniref:zinc finger CCCH domain-containing protein 15-like n=1 Tax=Babylonia areolata TaxID=304850 RepID=UPI003FD29107
MPPKGKKNEPSKKTQDKAKEKVIEDKTFGLKNKKGTKQQKFIKTVTQQVKQGNQKASKLEQQQREEREKKKDEKKKLQDELNTLFKPVQTVGKGTDPKSVLCAFFKQGQCSKGDKCKFSHDLTIERKSEKRSVYEDVRNEDSMDNWDEEKLNEVINKKHGETEKSKPKTAIICKHFLEAVENSKYGWFWTCPNGDKCFYRHALPPGFVLKKDQKKEEKAEEISLEDLIERERAALGHNVTRITLETFLAWKQRKRKEKVDAMKAEQDKKKADFKAGKMLGISGRQMFEFNPELITGDDDDDDEGAEAGVYVKEEDEDDSGPVKEINLDYFTEQASEVDTTGTQATADRWQQSGEAGKLDEAAAIASPVDPATQAQIETDAAIAMAVSATVNGEIAADMPIDEDLFAGDDIDLVEEDLETLDLDD